MKYSGVGIRIQYHDVATTDSLVPGYRWLYEVPKILHRDISLNNLMLRKAGNVYTGVLNDLDLAVNVDVKSTSSKHRTGTKPFMAIDLFRPVPTVHRFRHDLESSLFG
jgi:serine/threonine protein kinase